MAIITYYNIDKDVVVCACGIYNVCIVNNKLSDNKKKELLSELESIYGELIFR